MTIYGWMTIYGGIGRDEIAEIQRDAREGTVPVEDVRLLIDGLTQIASFPEGQHVDSTFDEPVAAGHARMTLIDFRAKHPNLFTK